MKNKPWLERLFPYKSHFVEIPAGRMHYLDEGEGPVVLCLHGNPTWCFYYRKLIDSLKDRFRVIAPDYLGCGLSERPKVQGFRAIERVEQLEAFLQALQIERFSLVMHDWGGPIGTGLVSRRLGAVQRLVYLNTTITETESLPFIIKQAATPPFGKWLTKYSSRFVKLTTDFGVSRRLPRDVRRGYLYPYRRRQDRTAIWDFVADIPFTDTHPTYADMLEIAEKLPEFSRFPVKLIWGLKDPCFHQGMLSKVAKHFAHAEIVELPNASHLVLEDEPEIVCREVRTFLEQTGSSIGAPRLASFSDSSPNPLYEAVFKLATERFAHDVAIVPEFFLGRCRYLHLNYVGFQAQVNSYQRGLVELGLMAGDRVLMLVAPGIEFLALSYAVMGRGAVPVFLDPGMGREKLFSCIKEISPRAFIGSLRAQLLRVKQKELMPNLRFSVTASEWVPGRNVTLSYLKRFSSNPIAEVEAPKVSLIAFTSGATGVPKGVVFTKRMLAAQLRIFSEVFGVEQGKKDLPLLPIFSLFSAASGVTSVFPPLDPAQPLKVDAGKVVSVIKDLEIDYSFGSPTLWNKIGEYCVRTKNELPSLKKVFMAGAPVPQEVISRVRSIAPHGEVFTPYGATEALPVTYISGSDVLGTEPLPACGGEVGTLVGKSVAGVEVKIVRRAETMHGMDVENGELPPFEIGEVLVRGENVSPEYLFGQDATKKAKVETDGGFWHRMGDMGYLDAEGRLYFCGRKAHLVEVGERVYFSVPTERIFNQHPKVRRSALIRLAGKTLRAAIVIEPYPKHWPESAEAKREFAMELRRLGSGNAVTEKITEIFFHPSFPVDARHNAKIFRDELASWAQIEASKTNGGPW
jgi:acyl-CoA synthetase (AMP-forming)/AMP-acid ligase II/pimeloyl-ACP methyl ester carboxylesterase